MIIKETLYLVPLRILMDIQENAYRQAKEGLLKEYLINYLHELDESKQIVQLELNLALNK